MNIILTDFWSENQTRPTLKPRHSVSVVKQTKKSNTDQTLKVFYICLDNFWIFNKAGN